MGASMLGADIGGLGVASAAARSDGNDILATARKRGYLVVGYNSQKPLTYIDPKSGKLVGVYPTILNKMLANIGIPRVKTAVAVTFDSLIPGLLARRWDLAATAEFITPERCSQVAFTNPFAVYTEGGLVRSGNPLKIHSYKDLAVNHAIRVGCQAGDAEIQYAEQVGVPSSRITQFQAEGLGIQALKANRIDIYLNSTYALQAAIKVYGSSGLELAMPFAGPVIKGQEVVSYDGWPVRVSDGTQLRKALNKQLATMHADGEFLRLEKRYGYTKLELPPKPVTAKLLCPAAHWH